MEDLGPPQIFSEIIPKGHANVVLANAEIRGSKNVFKGGLVWGWHRTLGWIVKKGAAKTVRVGRGEGMQMENSKKPF